MNNNEKGKRVAQKSAKKLRRQNIKSIENKVKNYITGNLPNILAMKINIEKIDTSNRVIGVSIGFNIEVDEITIPVGLWIDEVTDGWKKKIIFGAVIMGMIESKEILDEEYLDSLHGSVNVGNGLIKKLQKISF